MLTPPATRPADFLLQLLHGNGVHAAERLVEQDQRGVGHHGAGDLQLPPLAAREEPALAFATSVRPNCSMSLSALCLTLGPAQRHRFEDRQQVVPDAEPLEDARLLRQVPDAQPGPLVHRQPRDVAALEDHLAAPPA